MTNSSLTPLLGTGLSGLVGSKLVNDFSHKYAFQNLDLHNPEQPVDITQYDDVIAALTNSPAKFVLHFAAFTDVTKAWEQQGDKSGIAYQVNVTGTENIVKAAEATGKHVIHISTAYVFNGEKDSLYTEKDAMSPIEWYGQTKAWAEEKVTGSTARWTILRIDQPFRSDPFAKVDTAHRVLTGLQTGKLYPQFTNHYFGPTFVDDFAKVIDWVVRTTATGLYHASSGEKWSDYDFAQALNQAQQIGAEVKKGDLSEYLKTVNRPYQKNTAMDCSKLTAQLDFSFSPIREALQKVQ